MEPIDAFVRNVAAALAHGLVWLPGCEHFADFEFLQFALLGMVMIGPLCSTIGIQVVNFRMAFFAEAVGHSAYAGLGFGLLLAQWSLLDKNYAGIAMAGFGVAVALAITLYRRSSPLPSDTVIGVFSSVVIAAGLCIIAALQETKLLERFLLGSVVLITELELAGLMLFFVATMAFEFLAYNKLLFIGLHRDLAKTVGIPVRVYEYVFAALVALVVMFSVRAIGVLLVTAMLVIPAAAARNVARSAGSVFWWGLVISLTSCVGGLILSDQFRTGTGATTVVLTTVWFVVTGLLGRLRPSPASAD